MDAVDRLGGILELQAVIARPMPRMPPRKRFAMLALQRDVRTATGPCK